MSYFFRSQKVSISTVSPWRLLILAVHLYVLTQTFPGNGCQPLVGAISMMASSSLVATRYFPATTPFLSSIITENLPSISWLFNKACKFGIGGENSIVSLCPSLSWALKL